jgi:hypothetical protein
MYASLSLVDKVGGQKLEFVREVSSHAWLGVRIANTVLTELTATPAADDVPPPPRTVMLFDLDKLSTFTHTSNLIELATSMEGFTVAAEHEAILEFVGGYTKTFTQRTDRSQPGIKLDQRLQAIGQKSRQLKRKMKKATEPKKERRTRAGDEKTDRVVSVRAGCNC